MTVLHIAIDLGASIDLIVIASAKLQPFHNVVNVISLLFFSASMSK